MRNHNAIRQWLFPAFLAGALALAPQSARAIDLGGLAKQAAGAGADKAKDEVVKKVNAKLLAEGRKNQCSFKVDSDQLEAGCDKKLKKLADTLVDVKKQLQQGNVSGYKFEVSGHTDSSGKAEHNKELSGKRAAVIVKELVARGIAPGEIISVGMGSDKPIVTPDKTEAQKKKNRRYEIQLKF
jgi:outer membrane protein OmpA-like peptidoglycan-associated protein